MFLVRNRFTSPLMILRIFIYLLCVLPSFVWAQDPHLSQFFSTPTGINPAFTGITQQTRFNFNFRSQWPQIPGEYLSYQVGYDQGFGESRNGVGLLMSLDQAGSAGVRTIQAQALYAYTLPFEDFAIRAGLMLGYGNRSLNHYQLLFGDQLSEIGLTGSPTQENDLTNINVNYWDVGTGFLFYGESFWLGVSGYHLNRPNQSLVGSEDRLPMQISVHGGYKFVSYGHSRSKRDGYSMALSPGFYYSQQGDLRQLDLGANGFIDPIVVGLWYRGVPIQPSFNSAIVAMAGFRYKGYQFLYSFDTPVGRFASMTGGAHEISMALDLGNFQTRKRFRRRSGIIEFPDLVH
jgi:type IX secretion system PorP/SprF family membrane protein